MSGQNQSFLLRIFAFIVFLSLACGMMGVRPVQARTLTVSDCSEPSGDLGRLVEVFNATWPGDTIRFSCSGTIMLPSTLVISKDLILDGTGQTVILSGGNTRGVISISPGTTVTLDHLTITAGYSEYGGGIYNFAGTLTVKNSTFLDNVASRAGGGIYSLGTLTLTNTTLSGNSASTEYGGGIYNDGIATLTDAILSDNSAPAGFGGGIFNITAMTLNRVTLSGNSAISGAGIYSFSNLTVTDSTLFGNSATSEGGGIYNRGSLTVTNSTFSGNQAGAYGSGGGIFQISSGTLDLSNTILANSPSGGDCSIQGVLGVHANNLVEDNVANSCGAAIAADPQLGPLANNGGLTQTMALLPGSPAIDAGDNCSATDQRGLSRPQGVTCDIGAYEYQTKEITAFDFTSPATVGVIAGSNISLAVPPGTDFTALVPVITHTGASISPVSGVAQDFTNPVVYTVTAPDGTTRAYTVTVAFPKAITAFTIPGQVGNTTINEGSHTIAVRFPYLPDVSALVPAITHNGVSLSPASGVAQDFSDPVVYTVTAVDGTTQTYTVTAIVECSPAITVANANNSGPGSLRRAIFDACVGGTITFDAGLSGSTIPLTSTLNIAKDLTIASSVKITLSGGGTTRVLMIGSGATVTLSGLKITRGYADAGAGIYNGANLTIQNSLLVENNATYPGGAGIYNTGTLTVINSTLTGNSTRDANGGAIYNENSLTLINATIAENAAWYGSGVYQASGTLNYSNTILAKSVGVADCHIAGGVVGTNSHNLVQANYYAGSCGAPFLSGDPNLGILADNGGLTETMALLTGSPAIDAGAACPLSDQRGQARQGAACDIGAYEYYSKEITAFSFTSPATVGVIAGTSISLTVPYLPDVSALVPTITHTGASISPASGVAQDFSDPVVYTVTAADGTTRTYTVTVIVECSPAITVANANNSGPGSLRRAIFDTCPGGTITFDAGLSGSTIPLTSTLNIAKDLTIASSVKITLSGGGTTRVLSIGGTAVVTLSGLKITRGYADTGAGIYNNGGTLTLQNSLLVDNLAVHGGGGIYNVGTLTVINSTLTGNSSGGAAFGGGIYNENSLTLINATLAGNAAMYGSGVYQSSGILNYSNTILAKSAGGSDCRISAGTVGTNSHNLVQGNYAGSCGATFLNGDPNLGILADNGGLTQTMALLPGSPAIDAGDNCSATDQRGLSRPQGVTCDIGAYEYQPKEITAFDFTSPATVGVIAGSNISLIVPPGTDFTALVPVITHTGASISPVSGVAQDFTNPVIYTVTAPDGSTRAYTVTVAFPKAITAFTIPGQVGDTTIDEDSHTISVWFPYLPDVSALVPAITHTGASISPASGVAQDFSDPVVYTVTAADGTTQTYTVTAIVECSPAITVANANDSGPGSLRRAIFDACPGGTITFDAGLSGSTIPLTSTLTIYKDLTVASSVKITLSGGGTTEVLSIGGTVTLSGLKITQGYAYTGAGIHNGGNLTLQNSLLVGNNAVHGGGGIYNIGTLTVINSTLTGNSSGGASLGGGIYNENSLTLINATLVGNAAPYGGGLYQSSGSLNYSNTILAKSVGGSDCHIAAGAVGTNSHNLVQGNDGGSCGATFLSGDPNLGILADNGGLTETLALLTGSPAIDAGTGCPLSDQRGQARQSAACDIGAYEYQPKEIMAFDFTSPATVGVIAGSNITLALPTGADVTALVPVITHTGASISPASGVAQDFTNPVVYTVTAADGTARAYTVTVIFSKAITAFTIPGQVGNTTIDEGAYTIAVRLSYLPDVSALVPAITHNGASLSPASGVAQDFTNPVVYTVTATDGTTQTYTVTVIVECGPAITVANANDSGVGSLRRAISDACVGGTITFDAGLSGSTIPLTSTLNIAKNLTIASSVKITLSGGGTTRVLYVGGTAVVTLSGLKITQGYGDAGAGIYNGANLTLQNSLLVGNNATYPGGGGIYNAGTLTVINSTLTGNSSGGAARGGGIYNENSLTLINTTLVGNAAPYGGGLYQSSGTLNYSNTILAKSVGGSDCHIAAGTLGTNSHNLVQGNDGGSCGATFLSGDPNLGILADNGGLTETLALLTGSPAIDAGAGCPLSDQRGQARQSEICDIGAYEYQTKEITAFDFTSPATLGVIAGSNITLALPSGTDVSALVPTITHSGASISPASGVAQDFTNPVVYTVTAADGTTQAYTVTVTFPKAITAFSIPGQVGNTTLDEGNHTIAVRLPYGTDITALVPAITHTGASLNPASGVAQDFTNPVVYTVTATDGTTQTYTVTVIVECSPAITVANANDSGAGSLRQAIFDACVGGTITFDAGLSGSTIPLTSTLTIAKALTIDSSVKITLSGGGTTRVLSVGGTATVTLSGLKITQGYGDAGAGIYNGGTLTIQNSLLVGNNATYPGGGGIYNAGTLTVINSTLTGNSSGGAARGGGIYNENSLTLINATLVGNAAPYGGGVYQASGILNYSNTILAKSAGGSDCHIAAGTVGTNSHNLVQGNDGGSCGATFLSGDPNLGALADNGGLTATMALLTGSPAIDAGTACPLSDQRDQARQSETCDIGAYEYQPKEITAFDFTSPAAVGVIAGANITLAISTGVDITALVPVITHSGASISPASGVAQDFTNPVVYTVTAADGSTRAYTVTVIFPKVITAFTIPGQVGNTTLDEGGRTIAIRLPYGTDVTALVPAITYSGASLSPASGVAQDFTNPVVYTVTAADATTKTYTVTVIVECGPAITVANANDSGAGSLRRAVSDACVGGTITFDAGLSGSTIPLTSTLTISKDLTVASSVKITLSGGGTTRVLVIGSGATVTLSGLKITQGYGDAGAGIYNSGTLTIQNSLLVGNNATYPGGGGIYNVGTLTVINSTLTGNSSGGAAHGGAIYNENNLTLINATLVGNAAPYGGGVYQASGILNYSNTILAKSVGGSDCHIAAGTVGTNSHNLVQGNDGGSCGATFLSGDPNLGALADNGGLTETMALLTGSPAIDAGAACPLSDQRGQARQSETCDIGAYEYQAKEITAFDFTSPAAVGVIAGANITLTVPYGTDVTALVPAITHSGASINPASGVAQDFTNPVVYTVTATDGTTWAYTVTVIFPKAITAFTIPGQVGNTTIDEGGRTIAVTLPYGTNVTALVPAITHTGASLSPGSGVAQDFTNPVVYTVTAADATTKTYTVTVTVECSPALTVANANDSGAGSLRRAIFDACVGGTITFDAGLSGSSIALTSPLVIAKDLTIDSSVKITLNGGWTTRVMVVDSSATVTLNSLKITQGYADAGAGIYNAGTLTIRNSLLSGNYAASSGGGGIYNAGTLTVINSTLTGNSSSGAARGGGIYNQNSLTLINATLAGNTALYGSGVYQASGTLNYSNTILAKSVLGSDCHIAAGTVGTNSHNLVQGNDGGSCGASFLTADPNLGALADNGGLTATMALLLGSPAIDAGAACPLSDQRGQVRQGAACDIGAYEYYPKEITAFDFTSPATVGVIAGSNISLTVPTGIDVSALVPAITHTGASLSPASGVAQDFTNPVVYTVTAADGTTHAYTVTAGGECSPALMVANANDSGAGSLRQAISDTCPGGTITFAAGLSGSSIDLTSPLVIAKDLTIASSVKITLNGGGTTQVFSVGGTAVVTLKGLKITRGYADTGGGIYNAGTLTLQNSLLVENVAVHGGGGIYNAGTLTISNATLANNASGSLSGGGGVYNAGTLTLSNATLAGNMASYGSEVYQSFGTFNYSNTILANPFGGAVCYLSSGAVGTNSHNLVWGYFGDSCGATFLSSDPNLGILADNGGLTETMSLLPGSPAIDAGAACPATDQRGQARRGAACDIGAYEYAPKEITAFTIPGQVGNTTIDEDSGAITVRFSYGTNVTALVPTITHTGVSISPASGVAQNFTNPVVYIVTAEDGTTYTYTVTVIVECSPAITVANANDSGAGSLREAILATCPGGTITFAAGLSGSTIPLTSTLNIAKNLTIASPVKITLSGGGTTRVFSVGGTAVVTLSGLKITQGYGDAGAGIYNGANLTIKNSILVGNTATYPGGGGIYNTGTLTVINSTLTGNSTRSDARGGAIFNENTLILNNVTLAGNTAAYGSGVYQAGGTFNYSNTLLADSLSGSDCHIAGGTVSTNSHNLVESNYENTCGATLSGDPKLGALADNGGLTETLALGANSPAIDAGDQAVCDTAAVNKLDQRGQLRNDYQCDIGAFELKFADSSTVIKAISATGTYTFGPTLAKIVVNNTGGCLTGITVQRYNSNHPNATTPIQTGAWWAITPIGCTSGFDINLTLPTGFVPAVDGRDKLCRYISDTTWDCAHTSHTMNSITRNNVTAFSDWAIANNSGTTAITLQSLTARSGADLNGGVLVLGILGLFGMLCILNKPKK